MVNRVIAVQPYVKNLITLIAQHLARAVVPPPRLRAKQVAFSAPRHRSLCRLRRGLRGVFNLKKTLQNPAVFNFLTEVYAIAGVVIRCSDLEV